MRSLRAVALASTVGLAVAAPSCGDAPAASWPGTYPELDGSTEFVVNRDELVAVGTRDRRVRVARLASGQVLDDRVLDAPGEALEVDVAGPSPSSPGVWVAAQSCGGEVLESDTVGRECGSGPQSIEVWHGSTIADLSVAGRVDFPDGSGAISLQSTAASEGRLLVFVRLMAAEGGAAHWWAIGPAGEVERIDDPPDVDLSRSMTCATDDALVVLDDADRRLAVRRGERWSSVGFAVPADSFQRWLHCDDDAVLLAAQSRGSTAVVGWSAVELARGDDAHQVTDLADVILVCCDRHPWIATAIPSFPDDTSEPVGPFTRWLVTRQGARVLRRADGEWQPMWLPDVVFDGPGGARYTASWMEGADGRYHWVIAPL